MSNALSRRAITAFEATVPWVQIATEAAAPPTSEDVALAMRPRMISRSVGGGEIDRAEFDYNLGATGERVQDQRLYADWARQVAIAFPSDQFPGGADVVFWGDTVTSQIRVRGDQETVTIGAAVSPYLFGDIVRGMPVRSIDGATYVTQADIVFNPIIDGVVVPNASSHTDPDDDYTLFVSPDSVRTPAAQDEQDDEATLWTLPEAVEMICNHLNPEGTTQWIKNPGDQLAQLTADEPPELINVRIRRGAYLPTALDELLQPLGYNWYLDPASIHKLDDPDDPLFALFPDADWVMVPRIVVYKRGRGRQTAVYFQRIGEDLDLRKSNAPEVNVELDVLDLANSITGHAAWKEYEVTIELLKTWSYEDDELTPDDLDPTIEESQYWNGKENVWRRWVANEAGDWNGTRDHTSRRGLFDELFGRKTSTVRRRRLFPCLTYMGRGDELRKRRPPFVEWWDATAETWREVPPAWSYEILTDEIGVRFTDHRIPGEIWGQGDLARLRVTGTVFSDERLESISSTLGDSPNSNDVELFLDLSDKFHYRERVNDGDLRSRFSSDGLAEHPLAGEEIITQMPHEYVDDTDALQDFLDNLADVEQAAKATAVFTLSGLDWSYNLSDLVVGVVGRNISLNRLTPGAGDRPLQITGIVHDVEKNETRLKVESEEA